MQEHSYDAGMDEITGLVLCGGHGRRMGGADKPLLPAGKETLVHAVLERLAPQVGTLMISCRPESAAHYERFDARLVHDRIDDGGPLAGIAAGLEASPTDWCFICPGDSPVFPADLAAVLWEHRFEAPVIYVEGQFLFMLVRVTCAAGLARWLEAGGRRVQDWLDHVGGMPVAANADAAFVNINTRSELDDYLQTQSG